MPNSKQTTSSPLQSSEQNGRTSSPSPSGQRHRPPLRSTTFSTGSNELRRRRSSFFSESLSETHRSFRNSTDDLLLPRINSTADTIDDQLETSHWHSIPLGLALFPAVGGLFFKDGSAVVTDITLLGLAAIFLNWALRLPWEWYRSAQTPVPLESPTQTNFSSIDEEVEDDSDAQPGDATLEKDIAASATPQNSHINPQSDYDIAAAEHELRVHELLALLSCFVFPLLGAWLLHAIRSQLSRPSEGLVSNYNLTIFLLVAELRPLSHLMKLVQRRTLFLQRKVNAGVPQEQRSERNIDVVDIGRRLEELEAHVADAAATASAAKPLTNVSPDVITSKAATQASAELRKAFQPELDALNRAMRRYEKRMTISAIQVESRLQDLETRLKDVVVLAAAAQRNAEQQTRKYTTILTNWACAIVVVPVQLLYRLLTLPSRLLQAMLSRAKGSLSLNRRSTGARDTKSAQRTQVSRDRPIPKKGKPVP